MENLCAFKVSPPQPTFLSTKRWCNWSQDGGVLSAYNPKSRNREEKVSIDNMRIIKLLYVKMPQIKLKSKWQMERNSVPFR